MSRKNMKLVLDTTEVEGQSYYWVLESGKHSFVVKRMKEREDEDDEDYSNLRKFCSTLEHALETYLEERKKVIEATKIEELDRGLDDLEEHFEEVKGLIEKSQIFDLEVK